MEVGGGRGGERGRGGGGREGERGGRGEGGDGWAGHPPRGVAFCIRVPNALRLDSLGEFRG